MSITIKIDTTLWKNQLHTWADKKHKKFDNTVRKVAHRLYDRIVSYTPVGDPSLWNWPAHKDYVPGTLKASWTINEIEPGLIDIKNSTPYAYRVEYEGWSTQAPAGMMRRAAKEYPILVKRIASEEGL